MRESIARQRFKILQEIDRLDKYRCSRCRGIHNETVCKCWAAKEIRGYGDRLLTLVSERKDETSAVFELFDSLNDLTVEIYRELKRLRIKDKVIWEHVGENNKSFNLWKEENNLLRSVRAL